MKKVYVTTSWDDGAIEDLKLASLLNKYNIPATFYIPVNNPERRVLKPAEIKSLSHDFEIGGHCFSHRPLTALPFSQARREIVTGKQHLEDITGSSLVSFCYPYGRYNQSVKEAVGLAGFGYARTVNLFATNHVDKLLAPTTVHAYDHFPLLYLRHGLIRKPFYRLLLKNKLSIRWDSLSKAFLDYCLESGGIFHLWGHSWEIQAANGWKRLENVLSYIASVVDPKSRYTNGGLLDAQNRLQLDYYANLSPSWFEKTYRTPFYARELECLALYTKPYDTKGSSVLDIGCGTGRVSRLFSRASYLGLDSAANLISYASAHYSKPNLSFSALSLSQLARLKRHTSFDLIIIWGLFESEPDPFGKIIPLLPFLKPGSRLIFSLNNSRNPLFRLSKYFRSEFMSQPFPVTSFSAGNLKPTLNSFSLKYGFTFQTKSLALIPPLNRNVPLVNYRLSGTTLFVILDKT